MMVLRDAHRTLALALVALLAGVATPADQLWISVDVPAELSGANHTPDEIIQRLDLSYSTEQSLGASASISALHLERDGSWLFSPALPVELDGTYFEPRDLVAERDNSFTLVFDGSSQSVPAGASIDAVLRGPGGELILSFDRPVELGGTMFGRSDLVIFDGQYALYWSAQAEGVPAYANLTGAGRRSDGALTATFDVPVLLGGTNYLPGELVTLSGGFASYDTDSAWPAYAVIDALAFAPSIGPVPGGLSAGGAPLTVTKTGGGNLQLDWEPSCGGTSDYAVYSGTLGEFGSHTALDCTTGEATEAELTPAGGGRYYLVVAHNTFREGSYGLDSTGQERPVSAGECYPQAAGSCY